MKSDGKTLLTKNNIALLTLDELGFEYYLQLMRDGYLQQEAIKKAARWNQENNLGEKNYVIPVLAEVNNNGENLTITDTEIIRELTIYLVSDTIIKFTQDVVYMISSRGFRTVGTLIDDSELNPHYTITDESVIEGNNLSILLNSLPAKAEDKGYIVLGQEKYNNYIKYVNQGYTIEKSLTEVIGAGNLSVFYVDDIYLSFIYHMAIHTPFDNLPNNIKDIVNGVFWNALVVNSPNYVKGSIEEIINKTPYNSLQPWTKSIISESNYNDLINDTSVDSNRLYIFAYARFTTSSANFILSSNVIEYNRERGISKIVSALNHFEISGVFAKPTDSTVLENTYDVMIENVNGMDVYYSVNLGAGTTGVAYGIGDIKYEYYTVSTEPNVVYIKAYVGDDTSGKIYASHIIKLDYGNKYAMLVDELPDAIITDILSEDEYNSLKNDETLKNELIEALTETKAYNDLSDELKDILLEDEYNSLKNDETLKNKLIKALNSSVLYEDLLTYITNI